MTAIALYQPGIDKTLDNAHKIVIKRYAICISQSTGIYTLTRAQAQHDLLVIPLTQTQFLAYGNGLPAGNSVDIRFDAVGIVIPHPAGIAVSRCAKSQIRSLVPIARIMPRILSGQRKVRYLVMLVSDIFKYASHQLIHFHTRLIAHILYEMTVQHSIQPGAFFVTQAITRYMTWP